jgi:hypothetical protein
MGAKVADLEAALVFTHIGATPDNGVTASKSFVTLHPSNVTK